MIPLLVLALLLLAAPAWADGTIVNQSTCELSWLPPLVNTDNTLLIDLKEYRVYVGTTPPPLTAVPVAVVPASSPTPPATIRVTWPCASLALGQWYAFVTAADLAGNEGVRQTVAVPFVLRDGVSPGPVRDLAAGP